VINKWIILRTIDLNKKYTINEW